MRSDNAHNSTDFKVQTRFGLPKTEIVLGKYLCALQRKNGALLQGRMHVFPNHVAFACDLPGFTHSVLLKLADISQIRKAKTLVVVPNSIIIRMINGTGYFLTSFLSRNDAYHLIYDLWSIAKGVEAAKSCSMSVEDSAAMCASTLCRSRLVDLRKLDSPSSQTACVFNVS
jgi:hypothetical protein